MGWPNNVVNYLPQPEKYTHTPSNALTSQNTLNSNKFFKKLFKNYMPQMNLKTIFIGLHTLVFMFGKR